MNAPNATLRAYWQRLAVDERELFAAAAGTTAGHLRNVIGGSKSCSPALARNLQRETGGAVMPWHCRPDDWHEIWPELTESPGAPPIPPALAEPAKAGMRWWNGSSEAERRHWMRQAGDTGVAADAWAAYQAAGSPPGPLPKLEPTDA